MTTRKIIITNEYLRLCKTIDNALDKINILPNELLICLHNRKYSFVIIIFLVVILYIIYY